MIERSMFCDNCGGIIAAASTIKRVRELAYGGCGATAVRGKDICKSCQPPSDRPAETTLLPNANR